MRSFFFAVILIPVTLFSQSNLQLNINTFDDYTINQIDSVKLLIWTDNSFFDSVYTNSGSASVTIPVTSLDSSTPPDNYNLSNNYPNPFVNETKLLMNVKSGSGTVMELFNVLGERVFKKHVNLVPGNYRVNLYLSGIAKGIYFLRVISGNETNTIKLLKTGGFRSSAPIKVNVSGGINTLTQNKLSKVDQVDIKIKTVKERYTRQEISFPVFADTTVNFYLSRSNLISIHVVDSDSNMPEMLLTISGPKDTSGTSPVIFYGPSGIYTVEGHSDSSSGVHSQFEVMSKDTTLNFTVENLMRDLSITVVDTTENNAPVTNETITITPIQNPAEPITLTLDENGSASTRLLMGEFQITFNGTELLAPFQYNVTVVNDTSFTIGTKSKKEVSLEFSYPDSMPVDNLPINAANQQFTTDETGSVNTLLFQGNYQVIAIDSRIENFAQQISVTANGDIFSFTLNEKMSFNYSNQTINEDEVLTITFPEIISTSTELVNAYLVTENDWLTVNSNQLIPAPDANGSAQFRITAEALHGTTKESPSYFLTVNPMMDLRGWVIDNLDYTKVSGKVRINGQIYETGEDGKFEIQLPHADLLSSMEVWSTKNGSVNSFTKTYRNVPFNQDINDAALWVTTYDQLVNGVSDNLKLTPDQFRALVSEGVGDNIKTIDWQNAQNMRIWIDKDFAQRTQPTFFGYDALTGEEQQWIKDVDEQHFLPNIFENGHKLPIYVAASGEDCPLYEGTSFFRPDYGYFLVTQKKGPGGYQFSSFDHDNDGVIDAALISVGEPTVGNTRQVLEENASVMMVNGLITDSGLAGKTLFHGQNPTSVLSPGDKKVGRIQENMYVGANASVTPIFGYQLPDGTNVSRFYDHPMSSIDNIIGLPGTSSNEKLLSITLLYPSQQGVANAVINVNNNLLTTDENGYASILLPTGSYNVQIQDERIEPVFQSIDLHSNLNLVINTEEKISFSYSNQTINEDEVFTGNLANYIQVGTSLNAASFNSSTQWLIASNDTLTPNQDENGTAYFTIIAMAENGTIKESQQYNLTVNPMMDLRGWIIDNLDYTKVPGKVRINGQVYETGADGKFDIQLAHTNLLSELEAWSTKNENTNSFIKTYRNVPFNQDINDAALWVTTYDQLVNGVDDNLKLTPDQFRTLMKEGTCKPGTDKIMTIDWQNAQNMRIWIDKDFVVGQMPSFFGYDSLTSEEQQWIKDVDEQHFLSNIFEQDHKLPIYLANSGDSYPVHSGNVIPQSGYFVVTQKKGPGGYQFTGYDHDDDGIMDAAFLNVGEPTIGNIRQVLEENASIGLVNGNVTSEDLAYKTLVHRPNPAERLTLGDIKVFRIQENIYTSSNSSVTPIISYDLPDGTSVSRFYDHPMSSIDDIIGLEN